MIFDVEINSAAHYPAAEVPGLIELAEQAGFGAFWKGESNSTDPLRDAVGGGEPDQKN